MLVDDNIFCGSLNIANAYSRVRYGEGSFRDLNIVCTRQPSKKVRDFFRHMILRNEEYYPDKINSLKVNEIFDNLDKKYNDLYGRFYDEEYLKSSEVVSFLTESPP